MHTQHQHKQMHDGISENSAMTPGPPFKEMHNGMDDHFEGAEPWKHILFKNTWKNKAK